MATGVELASAYVSILPSTTGLGKGLAKEFGQVEKDAESAGKNSGNRFTQAFGKWAKRGALVAGAAVGAAVGTAVVGGMKSAIDQQQGQAVLSGLYGDASKAQKTLEDLKKVSSRSPLEYTAYQEAASALAYAGVEGDSAVASLENVGKAITAAGGGSSQLAQATGGIMKAVNNGGIAMMDSLSMISESGVPILSGLAEHFGVGIDEVKKMASEGKVNVTDVMSVMEGATGDTFQKMLVAGDAASETFGSQWKIAKDNIQVALGEVLLPLIEKITPAIKPAGEAVARFIDGLPAAFERVSNAVRENAGLLTNLGIVVGTLVAGMLLYRGVVVATAVVQKIMAAATMAWTVATNIARIATAGWAVQQRLLNMALRANPIGIVVTVVMLLVGAFILAYKNSETFRNVVQAAWAGIKAAASAVWNWIKNTLWPGILAAWDAIAAGAVWLYDNAILPTWNGIKAAIDAVWGWIRDTLWPGLQAAWEAIGNAAKWLYESIIKPVWDGIKLAIAIAVTAILVYIDLMKWWFSNVIAPAALWLWNNIMVPVWNGIKAAISAVVDWITGTAWPLIKAAWDAIANAAQWLYNAVILPVWNAIKGAIEAVVNWIKNVGWPGIQLVIKWIGDGFTWLYNNVILPVWNGIRSAIDAVVLWFQNTAWPVVKSVIDFFKLGFQNLYNFVILPVWNAIKSAIGAVVSWFRDTAWPLISGVIDKLKAGFQSMKDRLKVIWDSVKTAVIRPVANWLTNTLVPKIESVTDKIKKAFDLMKDGVKKAWDGIKSAARVPAKFVVEDVYDSTIKETFNGVAKKLGLDTRLPNAKLGFASGGVLPGYTPGRDVHQFYSPTGGRLDLSGGEAIMRPEFTRAVGGAAGVAELNRRARRGEAFAGGGVWGKIKGVSGDAWDWLTDKASTISEALSDPLGVLTKLASKAVDLVPGGGMVRELVQKAGTNAAKQGGQWLKDQLFNSEVGAGTVPQAGAGSGGWAKASNAAAALGLRMTSGTRRGARTAGSGSVSMHALGRARDYAGSASAMRAFFNAMDSAPYPTELLYSPMGARNIHRGGRRYANTGATKRNHYNHVHLAFKNGGVFDQGGMLQPGMTGINLTRKPEAVLDPAQTRAYQAHAEAVGKGDLDLSDSTIERIADALASRPNVVQIGSRQAGQLALAGAGANRAMGGRL